MNVSDWKYWLQRSKVEAWRSIAISLGIDPRKIPQSSDGYPALRALPNEQAKKEFEERWTLLAEAMRSDPQQFTAANVAYYNHIELMWVDVELMQVAAWLKSIDRELPQQLSEAIEAMPDESHPARRAKQNGAAETRETPKQRAPIAWEAESIKIGLEIQRNNRAIKKEALAAEVHERFKGTNQRGGRGGRVPSAASIRRRGLKGLTFGGSAPKSSSARSSAPKNLKR